MTGPKLLASGCTILLLAAAATAQTVPPTADAGPELQTPAPAVADSAPPELPAPLRSGPMRGPAEISDARIWLQTLYPAEMQLRFWPEGEPGAARLSAPIRTSAADDFIALFELSGLREGTNYLYEVYADGVRLELP